MNDFVGGSRWISETEPELGLGMVLSGDARRVTLLFHGSGETRVYARQGAPLTRVRFQPGDTVQSHEGWTLQVEEVLEERGLFAYVGRDGRVLPETGLSNFISFSKPQERLFANQTDAQRLFTLRCDALAWAAQARASELRGLAGARIDLLAHQLWIAHEVAGRYAPRVLLADEVGLGKTVEAGLILHRQLVTGRAGRALIVVPEPLIHQWFLELRRRFQLGCAVYDEERCLELEREGLDNPFLAEQLVLCGRDWLVGRERRQAQALEAGWDLLIVDEAHHLAWEPGAPSPEYTAIERLAAHAQGLLLLTATPEQLGPNGHYARLRLLDPERFPDLDRFRHEALAYRKVARIVDDLLAYRPLDQADLDELGACLGPETGDLMLERLSLPGTDGDAARARLIVELLDRHGTGRVLFRNTRAAMPNFPRRVPLPLALDCPPAYRDGGGDGVGLAPERAYRPGADAPAWWRFDPRVDALIELLAAGDKVLLICAHKATVLELDEALRVKSGVPAALFHEDMPLLARDRAAAWFADPAGARVLLCSEIGSEGRNFQFAHHLFLFDLPENPDLLEQRIGRLDRIGQTEDIRIHLPWLRATAQEILYRWYAEGLDAFARHARAAEAVYRRVRPELEAALAGHGDAEALIAHSARLNTELGSELERGRDRLLELSSFREGPALELVERIRAQDADPALPALLERLFDHYGVDAEAHEDGTLVLRTGEQMLTAQFPALPEEGLAVTFERGLALAREDVDFLSPDHPLVVGALDLLAGAVDGNCALVAWREPPDEAPELLLEAVYVLECVAPPALQADRFLPPLPLRVVIDPHLRDAGEHWPAAVIGSGCTDVPAAAVRERLADRRLRRMLDAAAVAVGRLAEQTIKAAQARMQATLTPEVERLRALAAVNPSVRAAEIEFAETRVAELYTHLAAARPRFDALRVVLRPGA